MNSPFDTPGPKPGSSKAIPQRKFIAEGYTVPETKRCVETLQRATKTGCTKAPGLTE